TDITAMNGTAFFVDSAPDGSLQLWKSDGTAAGTTQGTDIRPGPKSAFAYDFNLSPALTAVDGRLYFVADDGVTGTAVWRSDGPPAGTGGVADIFPGSPASWPGSFAVLGNSLYFGAYDGIHGRELWTLSNVVSCGNGVVDPGEECDDGNLQDDDACKSDCTFN